MQIHWHLVYLWTSSEWTFSIETSSLMPPDALVIACIPTVGTRTMEHPHYNWYWCHYVNEDFTDVTEGWLIRWAAVSSQGETSRPKHIRVSHPVSGASSDLMRYKQVPLLEKTEIILMYMSTNKELMVVWSWSKASLKWMFWGQVENKVYPRGFSSALMVILMLYKDGGKSTHNNSRKHPQVFLSSQLSMHLYKIISASICNSLTFDVHLLNSLALSHLSISCCEWKSSSF